MTTHTMDSPSPHLMGNDTLDDTVSITRRIDRLSEVIEKKNNLPPWVLPLTLYLVGQLIGGVWWGATMQSKVDNLASDNAKLWQKIETQELIINRFESGLDERIRGKSREVLTDWGYIHVPRKGAD